MGDIIRETRNRSRSKTPFLRSQCDSESCAHAGEEGHSHHHEKKKKTPNVQTIIEESIQVSASPVKKTSSKTISTVTSSSSAYKSVEGGKITTKTSDYSSEDASPETVERIARLNAINKSATAGSAAASSSFTSSSSKTTTVITTSAQRLHGNNAIKNLSSTPLTSTPKGAQQQSFRSVFTGNKEISQNAINSDFERSAQFSGNNNSSSKISYAEQTNGSLVDHVAYKEYKDAGEYWNKYPKTDYTYSKRSPHRREIAPGVVAMPNMSRRSLENHHDRVTEMIQREPAREEFIRRRYAYQCTNSDSSANRKAAESLIYDSQDEVDLAQFESYRKSKRYLSSTSSKSTAHSESWFTRVLTTVVTTVYSWWSAVVGLSSESELYKTRITHEERGFFGRIGHAISSVFIGLFRYIYLAISSVLSFDTWLLKSQNAENKNKKRFLLLLLILLPLLLLAAWALLGDNERHTLILRAYNFLPFTLAGLRNSFSSFDLQGLFSLPHLESSQHSTVLTGDITSNLQKSLSPEEYENILNHVNVYVQKLVDAKIEKQGLHKASLNHQQPAVSSEMLIIIANAVRENIQRLEPILVEKTQSDLLGDNTMQRIVENVQLELEKSKWTPAAPLAFSEDNLKQIKNLIHENIEVNNHHYNVIEKIDIDGLLLRILQSPKLSAFIDSRILEANRGSGDGENEIIARQQLIINELNKEVQFIKMTLSDKLTENEGLHYSINSLKLSQDDLMKRVDSQESLFNDRFSGLLAEIEQKLSLLRNDQFTLINRQVKLSLIDILGYKDSGDIESIDLKNWIRNTFVAKEFLEQKLIELSAQSSSDLKKEIDRSGMILMKQISEKLKIEILKTVDMKQRQSAAAISGEIKLALSENEIKKIVKGVLAIYDADKTGLVDFALESAGGQILSTRCTENYQIKTAQISIFGIPLWYPNNTPRIAISPNVQPGECWAFQGFPGFLVLRLNTLINVSGFTLEHIPKSLTPNGKIDSAPRNFTVWGLEHENDHEPVLFGEYEYVDNNVPLQYFPVQNENIDRLFDIVEMRIESNHGNPQYTCLYRFRVHGKPPSLEV